MSVQLIPATGATIELSGGNLPPGYHELVGASGYSNTGGEADETDIRTFKGAGKITGIPSAPSSSIPIAGHQPHTLVAAELDRGKDKGVIYSVRVTTQESVIITVEGSGNTVAIAAKDSGDDSPFNELSKLTFAGEGAAAGGVRADHDSYGAGIVVEIGGVNHIVQAINKSGVFYVTATNAAAAAVGYKLKVPSVRRIYNVTIRSLNDSLDEGSALAATLELAATGSIPNWAIV